MPVITGNLRNGSASVEVEIAVPSPVARGLRAQGLPVPQPVRATALIDTGADVTCIDTQVRQALGLNPSRIAPVVAPGSGPAPSVRRSYRVDLTVLHPSGHPPHNLTRTLLSVLEVVIGHAGYGVLLGCDVLDKCLFIRDGLSGRFSLAY